jgi:hypothetical protein
VSIDEPSLAEEQPHVARASQLSRWRVRMPPFVFSAFLAAALRKMAPSWLSRALSMPRPAVPNARAP